MKVLYHLFTISTSIHDGRFSVTPPNIDEEKKNNHYLKSALQNQQIEEEDEEVEEPDYIKRYRSSLASSAVSSPPTSSYPSHVQSPEIVKATPHSLNENSKIDIWEAMRDVNIHKIKYAIEQQGEDLGVQDEEGRTVMNLITKFETLL